MNAKEIRPLTRRLYECLRLDEWPSRATCLDFGIETEKHLGALQWAVRVEGVSIEALDEACGNGEKLTALVSRKNPYRGVSFRTPWDSLFAANGDPEAE